MISHGLDVLMGTKGQRGADHIARGLIYLLIAAVVCGATVIWPDHTAIQTTAVKLDAVEEANKEQVKAVLKQLDEIHIDVREIRAKMDKR